MEEARSAGSVASQTVWDQDSWASPATAARAASESVESPAGERARAPLRFPKEPPGGERQARAAFFCGTQYVLEGFLSKKWVVRLRDFKVPSINATPGGISSHPTPHPTHTLTPGGRFLGDICPMSFPPALQELCQQVIRNQSIK